MHPSYIIPTNMPWTATLNVLVIMDLRLPGRDKQHVLCSSAMIALCPNISQATGEKTKRLKGDQNKVKVGERQN